MKAIEAKNLSKAYGARQAVDRLNLSVEAGELLALLGVNGAGKTTTIKMLSCLTRPTAGDALVLGRSIAKEPEQVKRSIGVSPQETAIAPNLTARENLEFICGIHGYSPKDAKQETAASIEQYGLEEIANRRAKTLSGGWQRRLSIAMALITKPEILFLDEPTLGLDILARRELWEIIRKLKGKTTVILTTHYLEEAQALSDRVAILANGRLCALGTVDELNNLAGKTQFEDTFVALCQGGTQHENG